MPCIIMKTVQIIAEMYVSGCMVIQNFVVLIFVILNFCDFFLMLVSYFSDIFCDFSVIHKNHRTLFDHRNLELYSNLRVE